jgi:hypothetical protein
MRPREPLLKAMLRFDYGRCILSLEVPGFEESLRVLENVKENRFDGKKTAKWLKKLVAENARIVAGGGCNMFDIDVGRDGGSPVIYVTVLNGDDASKCKSVRRLMDDGKALKADEISVQKMSTIRGDNFPNPFVPPYITYRIRFWWD